MDVPVDADVSPGRPRSSETQKAILSAAFALLSERGYAGTALGAVAERAGAGKTTIYRWWANKAELAVDAFFRETEAELTFPDTGSAREDFRVQVHSVAALLRGRRGAVLAALFAGARTDAELARALGRRWLEPRRYWGERRMNQAVEDGECQPNLDVGAALGVLYGPLYAPLLFGQAVPSEEGVEAHLNLAFKGIFLESELKCIST